MTVSHPYIIQALYIILINFFPPSRNYNPVERRCKGGKDRNLKSSLKSSKPQQTNVNHIPGSGNTLSSNRTSGSHLNFFYPKLFPFFLCYLLFSHDHFVFWFFHQRPSNLNQLEQYVLQLRCKLCPRRYERGSSIHLSTIGILLKDLLVLKFNWIHSLYSPWTYRAFQMLLYITYN